MTRLPFAVTTPVSVARVGLKAREAPALARYYAQTLGLAELSRDGGTIVLGAGGRPLLVIDQDSAALPDDPREAGLFHTAFLLPSRQALARWTRHAMESRIGIDGASDHLVSEAVYLTDPEGNGIEIYADRPKETWTMNEDGVAMATLPLDFRNLLASLAEDDAGWQGAPDGTVIGHVHLRVGDPDAAEAWWHEAFGFDTMAKLGGSAVFLSSGGYHHHIGANNWHSRHAGPRDPKRAGLAWVEMRAREGASGKTLRDPWGTEVRVVAGVG